MMATSTAGPGRNGLFTRFLYRVHIDPPLLLGVCTVLAIGAVVLYSASGNNVDAVLRQGARIGFAALVMLALAQVNTAWMRRAAPWLFAAGLAMLALVLVRGEMGGGAQRWLDIGIRFQPSELMKLAVPAMLAWLLHERALPPSLLLIAGMLILVAVPVGMIALQPDLGTAILIALTGITVIFLAGLSLRFVTIAGVLTIAALPVLWFFMR
ncbi:MAG: FtsW/RodA/SpoVE family cell cycle protein, partial [Gammaproteobacteria bacterium]|nr:FtsW/RodA/SpoVE family cell cycle protein [Gammaproteobacteria bacterium]